MASTASARTRVLFVSHNIIGRQPYGGVEIYQKLISDELADDFEILMLVRGPGTDGRVFELYDETNTRIDTFHVSQSVDDGMLRNVEVETIFSFLLRRYDIALVHFQHLIGFVPSLPALAKALGARTVLSVHDYYAVCNSYNLIDAWGKICTDHLDRVARCDVCLHVQCGVAYGAQRTRRNAYAGMLSHIDVLLFPSQAAHDILAAAYPYEVECARSIVIGQPTVVKPIAPTATAAPPLPLRVAVYGNFSHNKGAAVLLDAFRSLRGAAVEFHLFGRVDAPYDAILAREGFGNVVAHGPFQPGEPPAELAGMHCTMHLSNWPETFCMTLSEVWQLGLVPIVSRIGALGERVQDGVNGFTVPPSDADAVVAVIQRLIAEPELLARVRAAVGPHLAITPSAHCAVVGAEYHRLCAEGSGPLGVEGLDRPDLCKVATLDHLGLGFTPERWRALPPSAMTVVAAVTDFGRIRKFFQYAKRHGVKYALRQAWTFMRLRLRFG